MKKLPTQGFTLAELMIAALLLSVAILSVFSIFFQMIKAPQKGVDVTAAVVVAESQIDRYLRIYNTDLSTLPISNNTFSQCYRGKVSLSQMDYNYAIYCEDAEGGGGSLGLRLVSAYVWWMAGEDEPEATQKREGYGRLMIQLSRLLSTRNKLVEY